MDQDEINRFGTQRAAEIAPMLIHEIAERLELDLDDHGQLPLRMLVDYGKRMFEAGYNFGSAETLAAVIEQAPQVRFEIDAPSSTEPSYRGPLGEGPDWDEPIDS
jgi:hypothetical protein